MTDVPRLRRTDTASSVIAAEPDALFQAFIDPEAVVQWLPPGGMTGYIFTYEPHEGGAYKMALTYRTNQSTSRGKTSDDTDVVEGRFLELVPNERIVQSVQFDSEDPSFAGDMTMTWEFTAVPGGTRVTITADNVPVGIRKEDHDAGLQASLSNLADFVT